MESKDAFLEPIDLEQAIYTFLEGVDRMRIAICDDERSVVSNLHSFLCSYANNHRFEVVIDRFYSGEALIKSSGAYDIIFLDYKMGNLNGLETAKILRERNLTCKIVFLTSYPQFIYESFKVDTFRFLEKPVNPDELTETLEGYFKMFGHDRVLRLRSSEREICTVTGYLPPRFVCSTCAVKSTREKRLLVKCRGIALLFSDWVRMCVIQSKYPKIHL